MLWFVSTLMLFVSGVTQESLAAPHAEVLTVTRTYSKAIAEVVHAVTHDDHPGDAGYTSVLHLLVRVAVPTVRVTVAVRVSVLLGLASVLFRG